MDQLDNLVQNKGTQPVSIGEWIITFIVTAIPLVGFIMLFVWGFGSDTHPSKKTWAQANLIFMAIAIVFFIVVFSVIGFSLFSIFSQIGNR